MGGNTATGMSISLVIQVIIFAVATQAESLYIWSDNALYQVVGNRELLAVAITIPSMLVGKIYCNIKGKSYLTLINASAQLCMLIIALHCAANNKALHGNSGSYARVLPGALVLVIMAIVDVVLTSQKVHYSDLLLIYYPAAVPFLSIGAIVSREFNTLGKEEKWETFDANMIITMAMLLTLTFFMHNGTLVFNKLLHPIAHRIPKVLLIPFSPILLALQFLVGALLSFIVCALLLLFVYLGIVYVYGYVTGHHILTNPFKEEE